MDCGNYRVVIYPDIKHYSAFTIVELMVVIGVVAVMTSLGIGGMIAFRQTVQLQEATSGFISTLRSVQNMARTSSLSQYVVKTGCTVSSPICRRPDGYAIYFDSVDNYSINYCVDVSFAGADRITCGVEELSVKPAEFNGIQVYPIGSNASDCLGIVFERLTGNITAISMQDLALPIESGVCEIGMELVGTGRIYKVEINLAENSIRQR